MKAMNPLFLFCALTALDGALSYVFVTHYGFGPVLARALSAALSYAALATALFYLGRPSSISLFSALAVSFISLVVSLAVFSLIIIRNPAVHWPIAFVAGAIASLAFAAFGYARAAKAMRSET